MNRSFLYPSVTAVLAAFSLMVASPLNAEIELIYQTKTSVLPGTDTPIDALYNASLFGPTPFIYGVTRPSPGLTIYHSAILYKDGALTALIDGQTGFPDDGFLLGHNPSVGGDAHYFSLAFAPTKYDFPRDGTLVRYEDGQLVTVIESASQALGGGERSFGRVSVSRAGPLAMIGYEADSTKYLLRYADDQLQILAQSRITDIPGTNLKFTRFFSVPEITADGKRVYFYGATRNYMPYDEYRDGLYYWENGAFFKVADVRDLFPGTDLKYHTFTLARKMIVAPDGTLYFMAGSVGDERFGILSFSENGIIQIVDKSSYVEGLSVGNVIDMAVSADGTLVFTNGQSYFTYKNGETKVLIRGSNSAQPSGKFWVFDNHLYLGITSYTINPGAPLIAHRAFYRVNIATGARKSLYTFDASSPLYEGVANIDINYFDISDGKFLMGTLTKLIYGTLDDIGGLPTADSIEDYFHVFLDTGNEIYFVHGYDWLYALGSYWPIVYSFTANHWLYLVGDWGYPLTAYAFGIGWIYSEPEIWPQYYDFQTQTWTTF